MDRPIPRTYTTDRELKNVLRAIQDLREIEPDFAEGYRLEDEAYATLGKRQVNGRDHYPSMGDITLDNIESRLGRQVEQIVFRHHLHARATHFLSQKLRNSDHPIVPLKYLATLAKVKQLYNNRHNEPLEDPGEDTTIANDHITIAHALDHTAPL
jgi:hypothetical protein